MKTLEEMLEQLKQVDEITLMEMMNLTSEDIVDRFQDLIENDPERYARELSQFFDDNEEETDETN